MQAASADTPGLEKLVGAMAAGDDAALSVLYRHTVAQVFAIAHEVVCRLSRAKIPFGQVLRGHPCDILPPTSARAASF